MQIQRSVNQCPILETFVNTTLSSSNACGIIMPLPFLLLLNFGKITSNCVTKSYIQWQCICYENLLAWPTVRISCTKEM